MMNETGLEYEVPPIRIPEEFSPRPLRRKAPDRGYSQHVVAQIQSGDPNHPGVCLGRLCVRLDIPVRQVMHDLGVSKPTVYGWFTGEHYPTPHRVARIRELLLTYSAKNS